MRFARIDGANVEVVAVLHRTWRAHLGRTYIADRTGIVVGVTACSIGTMLAALDRVARIVGADVAVAAVDFGPGVAQAVVAEVVDCANALIKVAALAVQGAGLERAIATLRTARVLRAGQVVVAHFGCAGHADAGCASVANRARVVVGIARQHIGGEHAVFHRITGVVGAHVEVVAIFVALRCACARQTHVTRCARVAVVARLKLQSPCIVDAVAGSFCATVVCASIFVVAVFGRPRFTGAKSTSVADGAQIAVGVARQRIGRVHATADRIATVVAAQIAVVAVDLSARYARAGLADVALRANAAVAARPSLILRYHRAFAGQWRASILGASIIARRVADDHRSRIDGALVVGTDQGAVAEIAVLLACAIRVLLARTNAGAAYTFSGGAFVGVGALVAIVARRSVVGVHATRCRVTRIVGAIVAIRAIGGGHLWRAFAGAAAANVKVSAGVLVIARHRIVGVRAALFGVAHVICARVLVIALHLDADAGAVCANILGGANGTVVARRGQVGDQTVAARRVAGVTCAEVAVVTSRRFAFEANLVRANVADRAGIFVRITSGCICNILAAEFVVTAVVGARIGVIAIGGLAGSADARFASVTDRANAAIGIASRALLRDGVKDAITGFDVATVQRANLAVRALFEGPLLADLVGANVADGAGILVGIAGRGIGRVQATGFRIAGITGAAVAVIASLQWSDGAQAALADVSDGTNAAVGITRLGFILRGQGALARGRVTFVALAFVVIAGRASDDGCRIDLAFVQAVGLVAKQRAVAEVAIVFFLAVHVGLARTNVGARQADGVFARIAYGTNIAVVAQF